MAYQSLALTDELVQDGVIDRHWHSIRECPIRLKGGKSVRLTNRLHLLMSWSRVVLTISIASVQRFWRGTTDRSSGTFQYGMG